MQIPANDPVPRSLRPGVLIAGRYRLERPLAQGGMGTVWVARHHTLDCRLALKFLARAPDGQPNKTQPVASARENSIPPLDVLAQFEQEAKAAAMLGAETDHVVRIFDYGDDEGHPFIAMELLEGEDLGGRLDRLGVLSPGEIAPIAAQIASALRQAHQRGVVHRDLKPDNVFLVRRDEEERVKILDFGLAKVLVPGGAAQRAQPMGTLHYMAPEVLTSNAVDARADLWSFAVMLYRAVTGALPFDADNLTDLLMDICARPLRPPSSFVPALGARLDAFFVRALSREPEARFSCAVDMVRAFVEAARVSWRPSEPVLAPTARMRPADVWIEGDETTMLGPSPLSRGSRVTVSPAAVEPFCDGAARGPKPQAPAEPFCDGAARGPKPQAPAEPRWALR